MPYIGLLLTLLVSQPVSAHSLQDETQLSANVKQILQTYRQTQGLWFSAPRDFKVKVAGESTVIPDFLWVANLVPTRLTSIYRICQTCLLRAQPDRDHLRQRENWLVTRLQAGRKFLQTDYWRATGHKAVAFLTRMHQERGALTTFLVAMTWLPYTAITEGIIEPILIGPLHTICPLFQIAYFGTLNFTHTLYRNIRHSVAFTAGKTGLLTRFRLGLRSWQGFPASKWEIQGMTVSSVNAEMAEDQGDKTVSYLLKSPLQVAIAANILSPIPRPSPPQGGDQRAIYLELTHPQSLRRVYFVHMLTDSARILTDLVTMHLDRQLEERKLAARLYKRMQANLGAINREIFALKLSLQKIIMMPDIFNASHTDMVYLNFHAVAETTYQTLVLLIDALSAITQADIDRAMSISADLTHKVTDFSAHDFIFNVNLSEKHK